ncbi:hypothetical protein LTR85_004598 [Meristemomyces frigidus]|nr:hypothetical protein LTR85_004598 [Meristemomyces frigidus]
MEEDDDDFYGGKAEAAEPVEAEPQVKDEQMDVGDELDEEEEDEDDIEFTLEKPEGAKAEPVRPSVRPTPSHDRPPPTDAKPAKTATPAIKQEPQRQTSTAPPPASAAKGTLTYNGKPGSDFPETRTSKLDINAIPSWPHNNKLITELDIDADLAEHSKPWRLPGTDQTDFFNYGFDEYTWTQYCIKQQAMKAGIDEQKAADAQMKAMFGGGGGGPGGPPMPGMGGPGGGGGGGGMPGGMPDPQHMEQMMQQMMSQGMNPGNMDFNSFMQMAGGMPPGMGGPGGPGPQFGGQQGGFGGSGQNSVSPAPGAGQGFQPPGGPQGAGGFNMEGFSPQQIAIMQQGEQGGGGRGRGRRGRW